MKTAQITIFSVFLASFSIVHAQAATISFLVDPATIDVSPADGFITGTEFSPTGSDGTSFTLMPTNNLVGSDRFLLSPVNGLSFGGGSGSSISFDLTPSSSIQLESYTIGGGLSLNNPVFDIREGATVLSMSNNGDASGSFASGPLSLTGGTTYSFVVTTPGAAVQRQLASWEYTTIPEPTTFALGLGAAFMLGYSTRQRRG